MSGFSDSEDGDDYVDDSSESPVDGNRRKFLKVLGLGTAGFGAASLLPGARAMSVEENSLSAVDDDSFNITDDVDFNDNDLLNVGEIDGFDQDVDTGTAFQSGMMELESGLDDAEIHRRQTLSGEKVRVTRVEFTELGGGSSDSSYSVTVSGSSGAGVLASVDLNQVWTGSEETFVGGDAVVEVSTGGSGVDAEVVVETEVVED